LPKIIGQPFLLKNLLDSDIFYYFCSTLIKPNIMPSKTYKTQNEKPMTVEESAIAYQARIAEAPIFDNIERDVLMRKTVQNIELLPTTRIQQINDFAEFILQKTDDILTTKGLQPLSSSSQGFDFLYNEPDLYSITDLKIKYS